MGHVGCSPSNFGHRVDHVYLVPWLLQLGHCGKLIVLPETSCLNLREGEKWCRKGNGWSRGGEKMGDGNGCNGGEKERFPSEVPSNFSAVVVQLALVPHHDVERIQSKLLSASLTYSHKHHNKKATANTKIQTVSNVSRTKCWQKVKSTVSSAHTVDHSYDKGINRVQHSEHIINH